VLKELSGFGNGQGQEIVSGRNGSNSSPCTCALCPLLSWTQYSQCLFSNS